ncbi:MAG TPA: tetratricopeptide repeat protein [Gemmatimonadaceae bacterium]|nr:tetratricopeptide repeat protein [Gemmatimonadaceae bacterium]
MSRGYEYLTAGDPERAEVAFRHALAFDPDFPEGENGIGLVARTRSDRALARRSFERAISLRPDFAEAHANLGELFLSEGRTRDAEECLRAALAIDPDLGDARQNLARALLWKGLEPGADRPAALAAARRELLHLLEADPGRAAAHHDLGLVAYLSKDWVAAEASYRRAVDLDRTSVEAQHGLCIALVRLGRCTEAVRACQACLELRPDEGRCLQSLEGARACAGAPFFGARPPLEALTSPSRSLPGTGSR